MKSIPDRILLPILFCAPACYVLFMSGIDYVEVVRLTALIHEAETRLVDHADELETARRSALQFRKDQEHLQELQAWQRSQGTWAQAIKKVADANVPPLLLTHVRVLSSTSLAYYDDPPSKPVLERAYRWQIKGDTKGDSSGIEVTQALIEVNRQLPPNVPRLELLDLRKPPLPFEEDSVKSFWWRGTDATYEEPGP